MKLFHLSQSERDDYDTYSDMVVCAESEDEARNIHPRKCTMSKEDIENQINRAEDKEWARKYYNTLLNENPWNEQHDCWCSSPDKVTVKYLGEACDTLEKGIVCSSYHAG